MRILLTAVTVFVFTLLPAQGQLVTKLRPETLAAFEAYNNKVEAALNDRWTGRKAFLGVEESPTDLERCLEAHLLIKQMAMGSAVQIPKGLIHDWVGTVFIPHTSIERVLSILENFDAHKNIYPGVEDSQTMSRRGNQVTGRWRLRQKGLVPVILDVDQSVSYDELAPGRWKGEAATTKIIESESGLFAERTPLQRG